MDATTCAGCGRAMFVKDVDADGNCPDCARPKNAGTRADRNPSPVQAATPVKGAGE